jgi:hypothetical protein
LALESPLRTRRMSKYGSFTVLDLKLNCTHMLRLLITNKEIEIINGHL